jgi:hypothetical protein
LYGDEDEEKSIRLAVQEAEKAWRAKDGSEGKDDAAGTAAGVAIDDEATRRMLEDVVGGRKCIGALIERWLDAVLEACFTWEVSPVEPPFTVVK